MHLYMSGTPNDDHYQVIENQICKYRLFSLHSSYQREVMKWLDLVKSGVRTFDEYCVGKRDFLRDLENRDKAIRRMIVEQNIAEEWIPYAEALRTVSSRHGADYPRHIMLDSGAFTAWNARKRVSLDDVKRAYANFLNKGHELFNEVWLINLDVIPGERGRAATSEELGLAVIESDKNLSALRAEFGERVLPVFHQDESDSRLLEVIDQARGYMCLSPRNDLPEEHRWRWAMGIRAALFCLNCNVRTHGLATTGNEMIRTTRLYSADSAAWKKHSTHGEVDLVGEEALTVMYPGAQYEAINKDGQFTRRCIKFPKETNIAEIKWPRYRGFHVAREKNDHDYKARADLIDNPRHYTSLPIEEQKWVREHVEVHVPFLMAQFDVRARGLVNVAELQSYAELKPWSLPSFMTSDDGSPPRESSGPDETLRPYPLEEDRKRFLAQKLFEPT